MGANRNPVDHATRLAWLRDRRADWEHVHLPWKRERRYVSVVRRLAVEAKALGLYAPSTLLSDVEHSIARSIRSLREVS